MASSRKRMIYHTRKKEAILIALPPLLPKPKWSTITIFSQEKVVGCRKEVAHFLDLFLPPSYKGESVLVRGED